MKDEPIKAESWYELAIATDALGYDPKGAESCYRKALQLQPFSQKYHESLCCLLVDLGDVSRTTEALDAAVDLLVQPDGPDYAISLQSSVDDSDAWLVCAEVALHALHHFDLATARYAIDKIPPGELTRFKTVNTIALGYGEEFLMNRFAESGFYVDQPLENLNSLPACRLNPARYAKLR